MRRVLLSLAVATMLPAGHGRGSAAERLQLQLTPTVSFAPASVRVRAIVEHDAENRAIEIVADSDAFYRRSVVQLDGERAPRVTELMLIGIPGGTYEVSATLYDSRGGETIVRQTLMVTSPGSE